MTESGSIAPVELGSGSGGAEGLQVDCLQAELASGLAREVGSVSHVGVGSLPRVDGAGDLPVGVRVGSGGEGAGD